MFLFSSTASATNHTVTNTTGLQNGINNPTTQNGDTLNLTAGTYKEHNIQVNKNLTITGPKTSTPTAIIDGQNQGKVFNIACGVKVTLQYLVIQKGNADKEIGSYGFDGGVGI